MRELPKSWKEVSWEKGYEYLSLPEITSGYTQSEYYSDVYRILTGEDLDFLEGDEISKVKDQLTYLIQNEGKGEFKFRFLLNDEEYYLEYDLNRNTFPLFKEIEKKLSQGQSIWDNAPYILASIIRKKKDVVENKKRKFSLIKTKKPEIEIINYELEAFNKVEVFERSKILMKNLNMEEIFITISFFLLIAQRYLEISLISLIDQEQLMQ